MSDTPVKLARMQALLSQLWELFGARRYVFALGLLLLVLNRTSGLVLPLTARFLIDEIIGKRRLHLLLPLVAVAALATIVQGASSLALAHAFSNGAQRLIAALRCRVQAHVEALPVAFYDTNKTGSLVTRVMNDAQGLNVLCGLGLANYVGDTLTALLALVMLLRISFGMTLILIVVLGISAAAYRKAFGANRRVFHEVSKTFAEVSGRLSESLSGIRVVKAYRAEEREAAVFASGIKRLLNYFLAARSMISRTKATTTALLSMVSLLVMYLGTRMIVSGRMTLGAFVTYTIFLGLIASPVLQLADIGSEFTAAIAGVERIFDILKEVPETQDSLRTVALADLKGEIRFANVCFAYQNDKEVLHDICFAARPGTITALVGPSGGGKSTIVGLIASFYNPTAGRIHVDGVDLRTARIDSYRTHLGAVLQETFLFDGTIHGNVAFSHPTATRDEVLAACRMARVDEFAERFDQGYDTIIGERGVRLSGGQRQRVAIARAILAQPRILILDEATSNLDSESEEMIQEALAHLMHGRTVVVIAHRLSTIRSADQILVLDQGRIVEQGDHQSLLTRQGLYFALYSRQQHLRDNLLFPQSEAPQEGLRVSASGVSQA